MQIITPDAERAERCLAEIKRVLAFHNCQIQPMVTIVGDRIVQGGFTVAALPILPKDIKRNG